MSTLVSYKDFSKLRLAHFISEGDDCFRSEQGLECSIGYSGCEETIGASFAWPVDRVDGVGEIELLFGSDAKHQCKPEFTERVMSAIGLPLNHNMPEDQVLGVLGIPIQTHVSPTGVSVLIFLCAGAQNESYRIICYLHPADGLCGVRVIREDMVNAQLSRES